MTVTFELRGSVAVLTMDDGKANALNDAMLDALESGLERATREAKAVVLAGRPDRFSGGFDLRAMAQSPDAANALVVRGAQLMLDFYTHPQPVFAACTGHAVAGGAILLMCCDRRIGTPGEFKIGVTEVRIGMPMPVFVSGLARDRLSPLHFVEATLGAHLYDPSEAISVGFLDEVSGDPLGVAVTRASEWAELHAGAYASTKKSIRAELAQRLRAGLAADIGRVTQEMHSGR